MKTALLAAAAALVTATPAAAMSGGFVGVEYSNSDVEFVGDTEVDLWRGEGAFGWRGDRWGAQIGGSFGDVDQDVGTDGDIWSIDGHLYWDGGSWRVGGVIAYTEVDFGSGSLDETAYGAEAMVDLGPNTNIFVSALVSETEFLTDVDTWSVDGGINFYPISRLRLGAFIGTGNADFGVGDADTFSAGIDAEFQPFSFPLSFTAGWNHYEADDAGLEADNLQIGARWNFGGTVQERDGAVPFNGRTNFLDRLFGAW